MSVLLTIGTGKEKASLRTNRLNRHGIIAGATGTGKTVTLKVLTEALSSEGIPVFLADIKGDLASIAQAGEINEAIQQRIEQFGLETFEPQAYPTEFYDVLGERGLPVRTTVSEMGPILLSQLLGLNETQEGVLNIAFKVADNEGLLLIDLKDLRAMLNYIGTKAAEFKTIYGNISQQSIGAILRGLLVLEEQGGDQFFGEPAFDIHDLVRVDAKGRGIVNVLAAEKLFLTPKLYATFLLWFLSELYETLPEVGDLDKPKIVFFFDEAHILFEQTSPVVLEKIELIVRLIRSKGVGIFFVTQNPTDIPDTIGSQLGNRIQHGLRAFTPKEQKTVKAVAETFRQEPGQKLEEVITSLKVGQAIVSFLSEDGSPSIADLVAIYPPQSKMSVIDPLVREQMVNQSALYEKYATAIDRHSAHEQLNQLEQELAAAKQQAEVAEQQAKQASEQEKQAEKERQKQQKESERQAKTSQTKKTDSSMDRFTKNLMSSVGREVGKVISRGIMGMFKK